MTFLDLMCRWRNAAIRGIHEKVQTRNTDRLDKMDFLYPSHFRWRLPLPVPPLVEIRMSLQWLLQMTRTRSFHLPPRQTYRRSARLKASHRHTSTERSFSASTAQVKILCRHSHCLRINPVLTSLFFFRRSIWWWCGSPPISSSPPSLSRCILEFQYCQFRFSLEKK